MHLRGPFSVNARTKVNASINVKPYRGGWREGGGGLGVHVEHLTFQKNLSTKSLTVSVAL